MILLAGALLGFVSVAFGSFAEHGLRENITSEHFRFLMTAVRYNQVHAVVIIAIGFFLHSQPTLIKGYLLKWVGSLFIIGTALFSFSIYSAVLFDLSKLLNITPVGGVTIMISWLCLAVYAGIISVKQVRG
jgi:uncharacterized membrane protein YgdD (TMEM256/DUF423 family)